MRKGRVDERNCRNDLPLYGRKSDSTKPTSRRRPSVSRPFRLGRAEVCVGGLPDYVPFLAGLAFLLLKLTRMGGCRTRPTLNLLSKLLTAGELSEAFSRGTSKSNLPFSRKDLFGLPDCLLDEGTIFCGPSHRRVPALIGLDTR
jgi:hypothetical protein